jgi:hypothetical protein
MQQLKTMRRKSARTKLLNVKVTDWELEVMRAKAQKFGATLSQWMRDAGMNWTPKKRDLVPVDETDPDSAMTLPEASEHPPVNL